MKTVNIHFNNLDPNSWKKFDCEDVCKLLVEQFGAKFPDTARIYHGSVSRMTDVTPYDLKTIDELSKLEGEFFVVVYPEGPALPYIITLVISVAASILLAPPIPKLPNSLSRNQQAGSPNNGLSNRVNSPRINGRIPDIYGTVRSTPDLIAAPYKIYENNREVEYMHFCIGRGEYNVTDIRDGSTAVEDIPGTGVAIFGPYTSLNSYDPLDPLSNPPQLVVGQIPRVPILTTKRSNSVTGQVLRPPNAATFVSDNSRPIRFVYPNQIEFPPEASGDFTADFVEGDELTITGATLTNEVQYLLTSALAGDDFEVPYPGGSKIYSADGGLFFPASMAVSLAQVFVVGETVDMDGSVYAGDDPIFSGSYEVTSAEIQGPSSPTEVANGMPSYFVVKFTGAVISGSTTYLGYLSIVYTGGFAIDLNGVYEIASVSTKLITLSSPNSVNPDWDDVLEDEEATIYIQDVTMVSAGDKWTNRFILEDEDATEVYVNVVGQNGLYKDNGTTQTAATVVAELELVPVDSNDDPLSDPEYFQVTLTGSGHLKEFIGATLKAKPVSFYGRMSMRMRRVTPADEAFTGTVVDEIRWKDAYSVAGVDLTDFGNVTTGFSVVLANASSLAVKDRKLNMLVQRKLPVWDGTEFSEALTGTNDAATILSAICLDRYIGNRAIRELDVANFFETCTEIETYFGTAKAREFCYTFDKDNLSFEEMVSTLANTVFCVAYRRGSLIKMSFEKATENSTLLFNHRNKIPKSEKRSITFGYSNANDGIKLSYTDPNDDSVNTIYLPENYSARNPKAIETAGVRDHLQAFFHAWRAWNKMRFRNTVIEFEAMREADLLVNNDRILVTDNTRAPVWEGEVLSVTDGTTLTLSQNVDFTQYDEYSIFLQLDDGTVESLLVTEGGSGALNDVILASEPARPLSVDPENYAVTTYIIQGEGQQLQTAFLVTEKSPASRMTVNVKAVNYDPRYYSKDKDYVNGLITENGYGDTGGYSPGEGTGFPIDYPPGVERDMRLLGLFDSVGWVGMVSAGDLPAVAPSYNFDTDTIDHIYQRYRIYDPVEDEELTDFITGAIDGDFAICFNANNVAIVPYNTDAELNVTADWITDNTVYVGSDLRLITIPDTELIYGIFQLAPGKFVIRSDIISYTAKKQTKFYIVTYTSPLIFSRKTFTIELLDYAKFNYPEGSGSISLAGAPPMFAFNQVENELSLSLFLQILPFYAPACLRLTINTNTLQVVSEKTTSGVFGEGSVFLTPLSGLETINYSAWEFDKGFSTNPYYFACQGIKVNLATSTSTELDYTTYTDRGVVETGDQALTTLFYDESANTSVDLNAAIETKLVALGYTLTGDPTFGSDDLTIVTPPIAFYMVV
jgi:hypothetical protein